MASNAEKNPFDDVIMENPCLLCLLCTSIVFPITWHHFRACDINSYLAWFSMRVANLYFQRYTAIIGKYMKMRMFWIRGATIHHVSWYLHVSWYGSQDTYRDTKTWIRGRFKNAYELLNLRALKISMLYKNHIFQYMGMIFCVEFQRVPSKLHRNYLTDTLKGVVFVYRWKFRALRFKIS